MKKGLLITIISSATFCLIGFYAGTKYQSSKTPSPPNGVAFQKGQNGFSKRAGNNLIRGNVSNISDDSFTISLEDGSSKIVIISESTTIGKITTASKDDLQENMDIAVFGMTNQDGSITAQNIDLNPQSRLNSGGFEN